MNGLLGDSFDDPRTIATMQLAQGLLSGRGSGMQRAATGLLGYGQSLRAAEAIDEERRRREAEARQLEAMRAMQMEEKKTAQAKAAALEQAYRGAIRTPEQQAMQQFGGPTQAAAGAAPGMQPRIDQAALLQGLMKADPQAAFQMLQPKPDELMTVAPGASVINKRDPSKPVYTAPREQSQPAAVQEYQFARSQGYQGSFEQWDTARRRAGATNIGLPRIDIKTGEGIAGQVGPMLKASQEQAMAGLKLVDSAQRIMSATQGGNVIVGPMADLRLKTAQVADLLGIGGKDNAEKIENTRAVVRGMAEQAVAARSQLGGQAQISNSEQELLNKATSGSIGELTSGEVVQIAKLNDRLGRALYGRHQSMMEGLKNVPDTQNLTPFFQVPALPKMQQPTGMPGMDAIDAELRRRQQQTGSW